MISVVYVFLCIFWVRASSRPGQASNFLVDLPKVCVNPWEDIMVGVYPHGYFVYVSCAKTNKNMQQRTCH